jgi:hypothetical protein
MKKDRRNFLKSSIGITGAALGTALIQNIPIVAQPDNTNNDMKTFKSELPKLPYEFKALEPHINTKTLEIH